VDLRHGNLYLHFGCSSYSSFVTAEYVESQLYSSSSFVVDICKPLRPMSDMTNLADQCCRSSPHHFGYYKESSVTEVTLKDVKVLILREMFCRA
jgi:hypothetical protein